jgi:hypothetical protein
VDCFPLTISIFYNYSIIKNIKFYLTNWYSVLSKVFNQTSLFLKYVCKKLHIFQFQTNLSQKYKLKYQSYLYHICLILNLVIASDTLQIIYFIYSHLNSSRSCLISLKLSNSTCSCVQGMVEFYTENCTRYKESANSFV